MPGTPVEQIKEKLDIVNFLRGYLTLTPAGRNLKANCPFHKEKTPSFMVSPDRQSWHCFGCGLHGDIFTFLMQYESLEFAEALKVLADKAGVELKRSSPQEYKYFGVLYDINNAAKEFFRNQLEASAVATKYLAGRGLTTETIHTFELGWAPNNPDQLTLHLLNLGFAPDEVLRAGISFKTERGMQLDRFRGRIMFPIHNHLGKVVGFTGRILPQFDTGEMGKYVNSPETPVFQKSKLLYGFWKSKTAIREAKRAFLVEGQMDFLMSYQVGVQYAVATSGTALTLEHLNALHRVTDEIVMSFDNDEAGLAAAERAIDMAEANDFTVRVAVLRGVKDPAEAVEKDPKMLSEAVAAARPAIAVYFERYLSGGISFDDREGLHRLRVVLGKIKNLSSPAEAAFWLKELGAFTGISEKTLTEEAEKIEFQKSPVTQRMPETPSQLPPRSLTRRDLLAEELLAGALGIKDFSLVKAALPFFTPVYKKAAAILEGAKAGPGDAAIEKLAELISFKAEEKSKDEIERLLVHLKAEYIKDRRRELTIELTRKEAMGHDISPLLEELKKIGHD